jgi:hypothetical protein
MAMSWLTVVRRWDRALLIAAWTYTISCCALFPLIIIYLIYLHPAPASEKIIHYFSSPNPSDKSDVFELTKIYIQTILSFTISLFLASAAYIILTYTQRRNETIKLGMAKLALIKELDHEIRDLFNANAIYFLLRNPDGSEKVERRHFVFGLDRTTEWIDTCRKDWHHHFGERTVRFIRSSSALPSDAEISVNVLHAYVAWFRRIRLGTELGVLEWSDVQLYWRNFISLGRGERFPFMCSVFEQDDMLDFSFLLSGLIMTEEQEKNQRFRVYQQGNP